MIIKILIDKKYTFFVFLLVASLILISSYIYKPIAGIVSRRVSPPTNVIVNIYVHINIAGRCCGGYKRK